MPWKTELTAVRASEVAFRVGQEEQTSRDVFYVKADTNEHAGRDLDRIAEILNPEAVIPTKLAAKMDVVEELLQDPALDPCTVIFDATGRKAREPIIPAPNFPVSPQKRLVVVDTLSKTEFPPAFHGGINVSFTKHFIYPLGTSPPLRKHRRLGYGVYGTVYLVTLQRDVDTVKATGERFALKVGRILDVSSKEGRSMETHLHLEVEIPKQMRHPHIAEVILSYEERVGFGLDFGYLMRPVAQCTMRNLVDVISGGKPPQIKPRWFACIASAVSYVHSKELIHGDIKPSNILIKDGEVYLADFRDTNIRSSLYKSWPDDSYTRMYASPEYAAFGAAGLKIDPYKSEAFSLGCVYYEMLSRYFLRPPIKLSRSENYSFLTVLMHDVLSEMSASLSFVRPEDIIGHPRLGDICLVEPIIELTQRLISYYHGNRLSIPRLYEEICLVPGWREGDTFYCSCQSPRANA